MSKLRALCISTSADGFMAGPNQSLENPLGVGGHAPFGWFFETKVCKEQFGQTGGSEGIDNDFALAGVDNIGAHIIGRNMFGPIRGEWDLDWKGWWGDEPPYHHDVFVLTHHAREPLAMKGGTTFYFVTDGIEKATELAREAAGGQDIRIGGGASTIQQFAQAGLLDELHIALSPVLLGEGERLLDEKTSKALTGYEVKFTPSEKTSHIQFLKV